VRTEICAVLMVTVQVAVAPVSVTGLQASAVAPLLKLTAGAPAANVRAAVVAPGPTTETVATTDVTPVAAVTGLAGVVTKLTTVDALLTITFTVPDTAELA